MKVGRLLRIGHSGVPAPAAARRERSRGGARRRARLAALLAAVAATIGAVTPAAVSAHPLGNFTINHFAAIRVAPDRIALDVVIDRAEIPAFQEQQRLDVDGDGVLAAAELEPERARACGALAGDLRLTVGGAALTPRLSAAGLAVAPGAGGLPTMRLVCEYESVLATPLAAPTTISFEDLSFSERIGWREIVVVGDGVTLAGAAAVSQSPTGTGISKRLTVYPTDLLAQPLDVRSARFEASPGGPDIPPWSAPDAQPIDARLPGAQPGTTTAIPGVPGGIAEDLARLIDVSDLNPFTILIALAIAFGLGVVHALSPGHGKTIMAAYLVGGRGSTRQAIGLGLAVAVSHTLGVLALALITIAASSVVPPERLYPILGLASGALVVVIGASLLWSRLRALRSAAGHGHSHGHDHAHSHDSAHGHSHTQPQFDPHPHGHPHPHGQDHDAPAGDGISWPGLIALGLSGGLVPSASALILLLGSIAAGVPAYGLMLVAVFGLGMAAVLGGLGLALVHGRRHVERRPSAARLSRLAVPLQVSTAMLVVVLGVVLTGQALAQVV